MHDLLVTLLTVLCVVARKYGVVDSVSVKFEYLTCSLTVKFARYSRKLTGFFSCVILKFFSAVTSRSV